jgi:DNA-binding XRE family transcriptional regulator
MGEVGQQVGNNQGRLFFVSKGTRDNSCLFAEGHQSRLPQDARLSLVGPSSAVASNVTGQCILHIGIIHFGEYVKCPLFSPPMEKRNPRRAKAKRTLLELLRQAREEAGVLQADLARKLGRKQGFVSKYELGDRRLDVLDVADICDALGISFTEFAKRFDEKRKGR